METLLTITTIFGIIGIPTIFSLTLWCVKACSAFSRDLKFIMSAIKSDIRNDLIKDFEIYKERTWCSVVEQTEWINRYKNYNNLYGENGVLEVKYDIIKNMPNNPPVSNQ